MDNRNWGLWILLARFSQAARINLEVLSQNSWRPQKCIYWIVALSNARMADVFNLFIVVLALVACYSTTQ